MTGTKLLKSLKSKCKTETEYNNRITEGIAFFEKLYKLGINHRLPKTTVNGFLIFLINEKVRTLRKLKANEDCDFNLRVKVAITKLLQLKKEIIGWGRVD